MDLCKYNHCADLHEETYQRIRPFRKYYPIEAEDEFLDSISDLLEDEHVLLTKNYIQHGNTTCYQHQISVAYYTYKMCKALKLNATEAARGAMLHDFFLYDWHNLEKKERKWHTIRHPKVALENARKYFELTPIEEDVILKHMWPLCLKPPKYKESFIITIADKMCAVMEVISSLFSREATDD